jgi:uncharacterized protein (UPF0332 family)
MKERDFLRKAAKAGQLDLVDPSNNIHDSYIRKSEDCIKAAELLEENKLYENSISESYYSIYNAITALLRKMGIKCENHEVSISLLETLFHETSMRDVALKARETRVNSQYYVDLGFNRDNAREMSSKAENFLNAVKLITRKLTEEEISTIREKLEAML